MRPYLYSIRFLLAVDGADPFASLPAPDTDRWQRRDSSSQSTEQSAGRLPQSQTVHTLLYSKREPSRSSKKRDMPTISLEPSTHEAIDAVQASILAEPLHLGNGSSIILRVRVWPTSTLSSIAASGNSPITCPTNTFATPRTFERSWRSRLHINAGLSLSSGGYTRGKGCKGEITGLR